MKPMLEDMGNKFVKDFYAWRKNLSFISRQWEVKTSFQAGNGMLTLKDVFQGNVRMDLSVLRSVGRVDRRADGE